MQEDRGFESEHDDSCLVYVAPASSYGWVANYPTLSYLPLARRCVIHVKASMHSL